MSSNDEPEIVVNLPRMNQDVVHNLGAITGQLLIEAERRGVEIAIKALRDTEAFWAFMETHSLGEDGAEFAAVANEVCAEYLEASLQAKTS